LLLDTHGVDVDLKDTHGRIPLFLPAENGNEGVAWRLIIINGVDPGSKYALGRTPLRITEEDERENVLRQIQTCTDCIRGLWAIPSRSREL
jgi:hypothetical protein